MWWSWERFVECRDQSLEDLKSERTIIAKVLLEAGADGSAGFCHTERPTRNGKKKKPGSNRPENISSLAAMNMDSGGPEIVDMVGKVRAQPRGLLSSCRLVIRRQLARPILLAGNVGKLPLPERVKRYVAMETIQMVA